MTDDSVGGWATRMKFRGPGKRPVKGYFSSEVERLEAKMKVIRMGRAYINASREERIRIKEKRLCRSLEEYI